MDLVKSITAPHTNSQYNINTPHTLGDSCKGICSLFSAKPKWRWTRTLLIYCKVYILNNFCPSQVTLCVHTFNFIIIPSTYDWTQRPRSGYYIWQETTEEEGQVQHVTMLVYSLTPHSSNRQQRPPQTITLIILTAWWIWKHRNGCIFEGDRPSVSHLSATIKDEARP